MNTRQSFDLLQEMTGWGWWNVHASTREIAVSPFLVNQLSLASSTLSFDSLVEHIGSDSREEVVGKLRKFLSDEAYEDVFFRFRTPQGYATLCARLGRREFNNSELSMCEGFVQCTEVPTEPLSHSSGLQLELDKILMGQRRFTQQMLNVLSETFEKNGIDDIMKDVFCNYRADIIRVYSFNFDKNTYSCIHESTVNGSTPTIRKDKKEIPMANSQWAASLLDKKSIYMDETTKDAIPDALRGKLEVKSFMAVPLLSKVGVWGFITIGSFKQRQAWSYLERETFWTIANFVGIYLSFQKSEREANTHSDFLRKLFHNMPLGYYRLRIEQDSNGEVTDYEYMDANNMIGGMIGIDRNDLIGKRHSQIGPIFVEKLDLQILARVAYQGEVYQTQGQMRYNKRHYNVTIYSPRKGNIIALFSDVTDTVLATHALQQRELALKKVYTNIPVGIEVYDKDGVMVDVNDKELEIQSLFDKKQLLGLNLFEHPSLPKFAYDLLKEGKDVTFNVNMADMAANYQYYNTPDYKPKQYLTIKCTVLYNLQGEVENYLLIIIDNSELYEAKAKAEESDRLKSAFLANMSHEIRTPLNAIIGFSDILIETDDKEEQKEFIRIIRKNNSHLLNLVSDILDVAKIESGEVDVNFSFMVVEDLCRQTVENLTLQAEEGVELKYIPNEQAGDAFIESDPKRILQILTNFLSNAIKFTQSGHIWLSFRIIENEVEFSVEDTGIGLAPEDTERIFDRFVKVDEFIPGTGLGLSVCRNISDKLGGTIGVESTKGVGSRFWLRIPLMQQSLS